MQEEHQQWQQGDTAYTWLANGMLESVTNPDEKVVSFEYDALGRRTAKIANQEINRYFWDGNVLIHEWKYDLKDRPKLIVDGDDLVYDKPEPVENLITWVYEENSFVPSAKLINDQKFSIINDYIGRPIQVYNEVGNVVWETDYDIYGGLRNLKGNRGFIPFRQLGQYEDIETSLYYNRFRYYSPDNGIYLSQDPLKLKGGRTNLYAYVQDSNSWIDVFGLVGGGSYYQVRSTNIGGQVHHMPANSINGLSHSKGPSIWMETADHQMTASHGWQGSDGALYRAKQENLISKGKFGDAIEMDIDDIQDNFGKKYNKNMTEMIEYAESEGLITKTKAKKLKMKCK